MFDVDRTVDSNEADWIPEGRLLGNLETGTSALSCEQSQLRLSGGL